MIWPGFHRTAKESRAKENLEIFDVALSEDDMPRLFALGSPEGRLGDWIDPPFAWDAE